MDSSRRLRINLTDESKAYGYTLCIWGSGAVLIGNFGIPSTQQVLLYALGAVIGFAVLAGAVYRGLLKEVSREQDDQLMVASMVHFLAALGTISLTVLLTPYPAEAAFFLAGANATVSYNMLMLAEVFLAEELQTLEARLLEQF